jgi:hypothetical protein
LYLVHGYAALEEVTPLPHTSPWLGVTAQLTDTFTVQIPKVSDFRVREKEHAKHLVEEEEADAGWMAGEGGD